MDNRDVKALELTGSSRISYLAGAWYVPSQSSTSHTRLTRLLRIRVALARTSSYGSGLASISLQFAPCLSDRSRANRTRTRRRFRCVRHGRRTSRIGQATTWHVNEKDHFRELLSDLCRVVPQPPTKNAKGVGRPTMPLGLKAGVLPSRPEADRPAHAGFGQFTGRVSGRPQRDAPCRANSQTKAVISPACPLFGRAGACR